MSSQFSAQQHTYNIRRLDAPFSQAGIGMKSMKRRYPRVVPLGQLPEGEEHA